MTHEVFQMRRFARQYKKLNDNTARDVDEAVLQIAQKPSIGDKKRGDLAALRVYQFKSQNLVYLLGYTVNDGLRLIYLEAIGPHENFYRDLKR